VPDSSKPFGQDPAAVTADCYYLTRSSSSSSCDDVEDSDQTLVECMAAIHDDGS